MTMMEKVARAMVAAHLEVEPQPPAWETYNTKEKQDAIHLVRTVIETMRDYPDNIVEKQWGRSIDLDELETYQAMIDAILRE